MFSGAKSLPRKERNCTLEVRPAGEGQEPGARQERPTWARTIWALCPLESAIRSCGHPVTLGNPSSSLWGSMSSRVKEM